MRRRKAPNAKEEAELAFWAGRRSVAELETGAPWYEWTFTSHFGLDRAFYAAKRLLDVGCGPRGSLEWADDAAERVGVDPLADRYRVLQSVSHATTYVAAGAERLPYAAGHFDVVSCFNALDHVADVDAVIAEVTRVARPGATLLLVVDVDHEPTVTEPHRLGWDLLERFADWEVADRRELEPAGTNMLATLQAGVALERDGDSAQGVLSARLERRPA